MRGVGGAPDWSTYESMIWSISEKVRPVLHARHDLRGQSIVMDAVCGVATDLRYQKGRQNWVLLVGQYGHLAHAAGLSGTIEDPDVSGHVIKALTRLKAPGHADAVSRVLGTASAAWVRNAAKTYLSRF